MRGKTIIVTAFAALLALGLCACGQQGGSSSSSAQSQSSQQQSQSSQQQQQQSQGIASSRMVATHEFATMQEVFDAPGESIVWGANESAFAFLFKDGEKYILVRASLPSGMLDEIDAAYYADDMDTVVELVAPLSVTEEITVTSPTAQEIQALRESLLPR